MEISHHSLRSELSNGISLNFKEEAGDDRIFCNSESFRCAVAMATKSIGDGNWLIAAIYIRDRASADGLSEPCTWRRSEINCDMYSKCLT